MKLKVDENLPAELAEDIRADGHDADTVHDQGLTGAADGVIMTRNQQEGRVMLTMDKGIADVRAYPPDQYPGIVLFRPPSSGRAVTLAFVRQHLQAVCAMSLAGRLVIVSPAGIRVR